MKSPRSPYSYVVLRYVHDIAAAEFVNVGVVLMTAEADFVGAKFKTTYSRIKRTFPTLDGEAYRKQIRRLQTAFDRISKKDLARDASVALPKRTSMMELAESVLRQDDSSLQWSPVGSGLSAAPDVTLNSLYHRFVTKYDDEVTSGQRKDEDVWKCFRTELEKRNVLGYLDEKVIAVADDSVKFAHAWKNGSWHCYEPLSFDLASDSSIKEKAHRWLGQVSSLQDAAEKFKVFFLVGKPTDASLGAAYDQAVSILRKTPLSEVVEEDQAEKFSEQVAAKIMPHGSSLT